MNKSLSELDSYVDELLKSKKSEKLVKDEEASEEEKVVEEAAPEEVVADTPSKEEEESKEEEKPEKEEEKPEKEEDVEKAKKSEESKKIESPEKCEKFLNVSTGDISLSECKKSEKCKKGEPEDGASLDKCDTPEVQKGEPSTDDGATLDKCDTEKSEIEKCDTPEVQKGEPSTDDGATLDKSEDEEPKIEKSLSDACNSLNSILEDSRTKYAEIEKSINAINAKLDNSFDIVKSVEAMSAKLSQYEELTKSYSSKIEDVSAFNDKSSSILAKSLKAILDSNLKIMKDNSAIQKSIQGSTELKSELEEIKKSLVSLNEKISSIDDASSHQPSQMRKSFQGQVVDKNFSASRGEQKKLSKSQVSTILTQEFMLGSPIVKSEDIISFETGAPLRPEVQALVDSKR